MNRNTKGNSSALKISRCKHKHTTEVTVLSDFGVLHIHQCDMCGVYVPRLGVTGSSKVTADDKAAAVGYINLVKGIVDGHVMR